MAEKNGSSLLERREGSNYQFPSLLTLDKLVVMFLFSGAAAVVLLLNVPAASFVHFRFGFILCLCLLLSCAVPLTLLRNWLNQLPFRIATAVVLLTSLSAVTLVHFLTLDFTPDTLLDHVGLSQRLMIALVICISYLRYNYVRQSIQRREESELHARIQALQSRIRPHFLFNSMNIIASLIPVDPDTAETVVEDLSELFRASLQEEGSEVSIEDELDLCRRYMRIEFLRLGDRLNIDWQIEAAKDSVRIPLLTLQPLLENAVYHGVAPLPEGGTITVSLTYTQNSYTVKVCNPLPAQDLSQAVDSKYPSSENRGNQLAIQNIRSRLDVLYGKRARLETRVSDHEFVTEITLPKSPTAR